MKRSRKKLDELMGDVTSDADREDKWDTATDLAQYLDNYTIGLLIHMVRKRIVVEVDGEDISSELTGCHAVGIGGDIFLTYETPNPGESEKEEAAK